MLIQGEKWLDRFSDHMRYLTWIVILYGYDDKHLLISDADIIEKVDGARKAKLRCRVAPTDDYKASITPGLKKVLVMCRSGELQIIKDLKREHPNLTISSGTYGFSLVGADRYPRLIPFGSSSKKASVKSSLLLLSTSYADAEFISAVSRENKGPVFYEFLNRHHATWIEEHRPFQIGRFLDQAVWRFTKEGVFAVHVQCDVLTALLKNTPLTLERLLQYWQNTGTKVVLVNRRDHVFQSTIGQILNKSTERSVWAKKASRQILAKYQSNDFVGCQRRMHALKEEEALLDEVAGSSLATLNVEMEDFIKDQKAGFQKLAAFWGLESQGSIQTLNYFDGFDDAPNLLDAHASIRGEWIDRAGVHVRPTDYSLLT